MVGNAVGTRLRIIRANRYNPSNPKKAARKVRVVTERGSTQTFKKKGDLVIFNERTPSIEVKKDGWF